jgi:hypothetical protein
MDYQVCIYILPLLAYALYQDWQDARRGQRRNQDNPGAAASRSAVRDFTDGNCGSLLVLLGLLAVGA